MDLISGHLGVGVAHDIKPALIFPGDDEAVLVKLKLSPNKLSDRPETHTAVCKIHSSWTY